MIEKDLRDRLKSLKGELNKACLIAVTKYSPIEDVELAYKLGQFDFGENRVPDLKAKADVFLLKNLNNVRWHFIGNLQTNKVKELVKIPNLWAIHSVDSIHLLEELLKRENEIVSESINVFFQVKTSHEEEKSGFESMEELKEALELLNSRKNSKLKLYGLMTMGAIRTTDIKGAAIASFKELKTIRDLLTKKYNLPELKLSMGMSGDYKEALEVGADYIRVGSLIFK
ncbi:MAG: YggS family pyridoxal phosphate-dependent enzyme [Bdellovibrionales bacterium]|nr:YggS family pyridoxal phosphate-dependent enzyme [Bdellovibrionales bacterium]